MFLSLSLAVESSYNGPCLDDDISLQFMKDLLEWFKNQKTLHKKYAFKLILQAKDIFEKLDSLVDIVIPEQVLMIK